MSLLTTILRPKGGLPWYLNCGIPKANFVAVYRAKGATSYAASKINLVNPGTYDATNGAAFPTWATATGWTFNAALVQYLETGIIHANCNYSLFVQYADIAVTCALYGAYDDAAANDVIYVDLAGGNIAVYNGGVNSTAPVLATGNYGFAGKKRYRNGVEEVGEVPAGGTPSVLPSLIGANAQPGPYNYVTGKIYSIVVCKVVLIPAQITKLVTAMAAL